MAVCCIAIAVPLALFVDFPTHRYRATLLDIAPRTIDHAAAVLMLILKNTLMFTPALAIASMIMIASARRRLAWAALWIALVLVAVIVVIDARLLAVTGRHAWEYVHFLSGPDALAWAGGPSMIINSGLRVLAVALTCVAIGPLIAWAVSRFPKAGAALACLPTAGLAAALTIDSPATQLAKQTSPIPLPAWVIGNQYNDGILDSLQLTDEQHRALVAIFETAPGLSESMSIDTPSPPHVVWIVLESWRYDALTPAISPNLYRNANQGIWLRDHTAGGNATQLGLFSLFYGASATAYHGSLDAAVPPHAITAFRQSGYRTHFISSADHIGWARMDEFISETTFDEMELRLAGDWPARDQEVIDRARAILADAGDPQFLVLFISSTHYPYEYPADFERYSPVVPPEVDFLSLRPADRPLLWNRYRNAVAFVDTLVEEFVRSIDLGRTVVIVTGDHGESLFDDGTLTHVTLPSDIQVRVPAFVLGPGVQPQQWPLPSGNADIFAISREVIRDPLSPDLAGAMGTSNDAADRPVVVAAYQPPSPRPTGVIYSRLGRLQVRANLTTGRIESAALLGPGGRPLPRQEMDGLQAAAWRRHIDDVTRR
jgi:hypothetical protein